MKIVKAVSKIVLFTALVLLLGQVPIGRTTVGKGFADSVQAGWKAGTAAIQATDWYHSFVQLPVFNSWLKAPAPSSPTTSEKEKAHPSHLRQSELSTEDDGEKITAADRDSLIRLLE